MKNDIIEEKPLVIEQAQRVTPTPTSTVTGYRRKKYDTKYGSYRTLNSETYKFVIYTFLILMRILGMSLIKTDSIQAGSDMDDLCDPDFYLNYTAPTTVAETPPKPPERSTHTTKPLRTNYSNRSIQLPRKQYQPIESFT
ncbi:hypothetical protein DICVIV_11160 [Dictyocaulus viviparus]|uniref:Uncharacterized protein n=1 Tax=Dictyocaulus viviparus TaxID=29172 RepID=A0A0D8XDY6_DICVI|nr:hypothetical protein DICVIV_11160 [Dictyocaulus viviparus]